MNLEMYNCNNHNTCYDCKDKTCIHSGKKASDCPYYICPNPDKDCEKDCKIIDEFIENERKFYKQVKEE